MGKAAWKWRPAGALLVGSAVAAVAWFVWQRLEPGSPPDDEKELVQLPPDLPPPDPRLRADVLFRNVRPPVRYVGDAACRDCHADISASYQQHPMGRSATTDLVASKLEQWQAQAWVRGPYRLELRPQRQHRLAAADDGPDGSVYEVRLDVAIGSGTRGRSYLTVEQSAVWQSPLSWFSEAQRWDVSPGFDLGQGGRRPIGSDCLFCHVHQVEPLPGAINRYREPLFPQGQAAIGCERCHGPGELHVQERASGLPIQGVIDTSIVNPRHLEVERQQDVCRQCHLQGQARTVRRGRQIWEYRPGLAWEEFVRVCVRHPDWSGELRSVGQFEQMEQSRCYTGSNGQLLCVSCHDPHGVPAREQRDDFYRRRCLQCHQPQACTLPREQRQSRRDSCIACHMPRTASGNIAHTSLTDHRIPRRPGAATGPPRSPADTLPLLLYRQRQLPAETESKRDLAIAMARLSLQMPAGAIAHRLADWAATQLENALALHCGDVEAWVAVSEARLGLGHLEQAWQAAEYALQLQPEHELAWRRLVDATLALHRYDRAEVALGRLVRLNPSCVDYHLLYAALRIAQREWSVAEIHCRHALDIQPLHPQALLYLALCRHHAGERAAAEQLLERAVRLSTSPEQRQHYRQWFRQQVDRQ